MTRPVVQIVSLPVFTVHRAVIAIESRPSVCLSVCLSVCDVDVSWSYKLGYFENNYTNYY